MLWQVRMRFCYFKTRQQATDRAVNGRCHSHGHGGGGASQYVEFRVSRISSQHSAVSYYKKAISYFLPAARSDLNSSKWVSFRFMGWRLCVTCMRNREEKADGPRNYRQRGPVRASFAKMERGRFEHPTPGRSSFELVVETRGSSSFGGSAERQALPIVGPRSFGAAKMPLTVYTATTGCKVIVKLPRQPNPAVLWTSYSRPLANRTICTERVRPVELVHNIAGQERTRDAHPLHKLTRQAIQHSPLFTHV